MLISIEEKADKLLQATGKFRVSSELRGRA